MEQYQGKSVLEKTAIGKIFFREKDISAVQREQAEDPKTELERFARARQEAANELQQLSEKAEKEAGEAGAEIFRVHRMLLEDEEYCGYVEDLIRQERVRAAYAVSVAGIYFAQMFDGLEDAYMKARAADIREISGRLVRILREMDSNVKTASGAGARAAEEIAAEQVIPAEKGITEPVILAAEDLLPGALMQLDRSKLLGFITQQGSVNSHTAILARLMNLPGMVGVPVQKEWDGKTVILDGHAGTVIVEPDEKAILAAKEECAKEARRTELLKKLKGRQTVTKSGQEIRLYANIGSASDVEKVFANDAEGIGLFRSEFLYLGADHSPTEEEQFQVYREVLQRMGEKEVVIRTADLGADKRADYLESEPEENPALGCRGIRLGLMQKELFQTQLRALLRASVFGNLAILFPMITSVEEFLQAKRLVSETKAQLCAAGIPCKKVRLGAMIETPAAALISDLLAKEADFFSIGTNDLTQYTLAIDRQNAKLHAFYDARHEAVLRLVRMTVENGHKAGIPVGICGELGADKKLTKQFVQMKVDVLSVSPIHILPLRELICSIS